MRTFFALAMSLVLVGLSSVNAAELTPGDKVPSFAGLEGTDGKTYSLDKMKDSKVIVVAFTCNECPVAVGYQDKFKAFAEKHAKDGVTFVAVNSNNATEDLAAMKEAAKERGFNFPYVFDKTGSVADSFGAKVTPHLFVLDENRKLVFSGPFDNKQEGADKHFVEDAVKAALAGKTPEVAKARPFGCGIHKTK